VQRGDVYELASPPGVRAHEPRGRRYGVVLQADALLRLSTWVIAPTSTSARSASFRPEIEAAGGMTRVLVEQLGAVDPQRLGSRVGHLRFEELRAVERAARVVLDL
jgi:mRNA interferase MazF